MDDILERCRNPPQVTDMAELKGSKYFFMIAVTDFTIKKTYFPFLNQDYKYDPNSSRNRDPKALNEGKPYDDKWDDNHVRMPCSAKYVYVSGNHRNLYLENICLY